MKKLFLTLAIVFMSTQAWAAGSCTQKLIGTGSHKVLEMTWTTAAAGVDIFTATETDHAINGMVLMAETNPSGTAAPTDNYDITLRNDQGIDVFGDSGAAGSEAEDGSLANRDTAVSEQTQPLIDGSYSAVPVMGNLTLDVFNAGNSKSGTIRIHFIEMR